MPAPMPIRISRATLEGPFGRFGATIGGLPGYRPAPHPPHAQLPHELRHATASLAISAGDAVKAVQ